MPFGSAHVPPTAPAPAPPLRPLAWLPLACFALYAALIINGPVDTINEDEVFYFHQAAEIQRGRWVGFENTQPWLYPSILALDPAHSAQIGRGITAAFGGLAVGLLYLLACRFVSPRAAVVAALLMGLSKFYVQYATTMHTEMPFIALSLGAALLLMRLCERDERPKFLPLASLGLLLGLAMLVRMSGIAQPPIFAAVALLHPAGRKRAAPIAMALLASYLLLLPYHVSTEGKFLAEKTALIAFPAWIYVRLLLLTVASFSVPFLLLPLLSAATRLPTLRQGLLWLYPLAYTAAVLVSGTYPFPRHFLPILPFLCVLSVRLLDDAPSVSLRRTFLVLLAVAFVANVRILPELPRQLRNKLFYVRVPSGCDPVTHFDVQGARLELPRFDQPSYSVQTYRGEARLTARRSHLYLVYLDDRARDVVVGGRSLAGAALVEPSWRYNGIYAVSLAPGLHTLLITVENGDNVGGIGQVLFCDGLLPDDDHVDEVFEEFF